MYEGVKRVMDIFFSLLGIIFFSWLFLFIIIWVKMDSKGPVFFKQKRVGKNKKYFYMHKFRTMKIDAPSEVPTHMLTNPNEYITKAGKFLRRTSLDELPQLYDVLVGNMSFVGPRPALWNQEDLIRERDKYGANMLTPGITGWAQVNGRDELEISVKAAFDGEYVRKKGFLFDIRCLVLTLKSVIKSDGVVEGGTGEINRAREIANEKNINNR